MCVTWNAQQLSVRTMSCFVLYVTLCVLFQSHFDRCKKVRWHCKQRMSLLDGPSSSFLIPRNSTKRYNWCCGAIVSCPALTFLKAYFQNGFVDETTSRWGPSRCCNTAATSPKSMQLLIVNWTIVHTSSLLKLRISYIQGCSINKSLKKWQRSVRIQIGSIETACTVDGGAKGPKRRNCYNK